jgi:hypothetical protein
MIQLQIEHVQSLHVYQRENFVVFQQLQFLDGRESDEKQYFRSFFSDEYIQFLKHNVHHVRHAIFQVALQHPE